MKMVCAAAVMAGVVASAQGVIVENFDSFADRQNINGLNLGVVTVTNPSGNVEVFANNRFGVGFASAPNCIASFVPGGAQSSNPMIFTFSVAQTQVALSGGDGGNDQDAWRLDAYDAMVGGNLVDSSAGLSPTGNPYLRLSVSGASILRVEAVWTGPTAFGIGYDNLEYNVPAPGAAALLGMGGLLASRRRR